MSCVCQCVCQCVCEAVGVCQCVCQCVCEAVGVCEILTVPTWALSRPLGLDDDLGPSSEDGGPHAVVQGVRGQPEELVPGVRAHAVDEQAEVDRHHRLAQHDVQPRLLLALGRHQQGDEGRDPWVKHTHDNRRGSLHHSKSFVLKSLQPLKWK